MDHVLNNFQRFIIVIITFYLLYFISKDSIKDIKHFIKRFLFSLILVIICSIIILIGFISNHFIYHILNDNITAGINCLLRNTINNLNYVNIIDLILIIVIPSTLITIYSFYANNFNQSLKRSLFSSITIFLMADLIIIILGNEPSSTFNGILLGLFNDIIGGIIFGFLIAITLFYYKRLLIDSAFDRNIKLYKYNRLLFTLALGSIFIYFIFFYRTYNTFSLTLNDYDLFKFQFYNKNADNKIKVVIPTTGIYFEYEGDTPFYLDWDYKDKHLLDNKTRILCGSLNIDKVGELFKDRKLFSELIIEPKKEDIYKILKIFNLLISKTIEPGEIRVTGDKSFISVKEAKGDKEIILELTFPNNCDIAIFKDLKKFPRFSIKQKKAFEQLYSTIYDKNKVISFIGTNNIDVKILNAKIIVLFLLDVKETRSDLKKYMINLPIHEGEIIIPSKEINNSFLVIGNNEQEKDIIIHNILKGCCFEIDSNSLIAEMFKNHEVNDILMTNIQGKLHYIDKEINFNKDDILSIYGNKLAIGQMSQGALTITGQSRKVIVNNQEVGRTVFSSLSGGIQILSGIIILIFTILTFVFTFVVDVKNGKRSKKGGIK